MILRGNVFSKTLEIETGIQIIVPNHYEVGGKYKVIYLLHGVVSNQDSLTDYTMLPAYVQAQNAIVIMPNVNRSFYTDQIYGQRFFSYVSEELPEICENVFNISSKREDTAVIGVSMGGYGALKCALSKPEVFGMCCAISSGCVFLKDFFEEMNSRGDDEDFIAVWGQQFINDFRAAFGNPLVWKPEYELLSLAKNINENHIKPKLYMTCGTEDYLQSLNQAFSEEMGKLDFDFTYEALPGNHDWQFMNDGLKRSLEMCFPR